MKLDPGCNGLVFIQMKRRDGDPSPKDIAQHAMTSAAATKKHMSRFALLHKTSLYQEFCNY